MVRLNNRIRRFLDRKGEPMTIGRTNGLIRCPRCGRTQQKGGECQACGVIFDRYYEVKRRRDARAALEADRKRQRKNTLKVLVIGLFLPCCVLAASWNLGPSGDDFVTYLRSALPTIEEEAVEPPVAVRNDLQPENDPRPIMPLEEPTPAENCRPAPLPVQNRRQVRPETGNYVFYPKPPRRIPSREIEYYKEYCYQQRSRSYRAPTPDSNGSDNEKTTNIRLNTGFKSSEHGFDGNGRLVDLQSRKK